MNNYLITGSMGCIGAWTVRHLVKRGERVVSFDLSENRSRLNLLLSANEQAVITFVRGDLTDRAQVEETIKAHNITHIIHLGALQVPFCKANPVQGALVNVIGTLNIFEGAIATNIGHVVYASSIAVYGPPEEYPPGLIQHSALLKPSTLYGGYKQCNEQNAQVYRKDYGLSTTALRPYVVYGMGRDQGLTSDPTKAMLAAAAGQDYHIGFGGSAQYQFASDVALQFIEAADYPLDGAFAFNLGGRPAAMQEVVDAIREVVPDVAITFEATQLPFPPGFDDSTLRESMAQVFETPIVDGIQSTIEQFRECLRDGRLSIPV
ncbi:MAG: NAD(P)-dependent oxidoreductase [Chloroflexi bacterium]|nr:NAD(P)-dependent oxidoreductase [Chloroflexota bacterium]